MKSGNEPTWTEEIAEPAPSEPSSQPRVSWREAPIELWAFVVFTIAVVLADGVLMLAFQPVYASLIPYVGWCPSMCYMFSIFFAVMLLVQRNAGMRFALILMLGFGVVRGLVDVVRLADREPFNNPYLDVSPYRPIWTIVVPIVWACVLLSPRIKRYCRR